MFKKLLGTLLFFAIASFSAAGWAQVIGYVHEVKGDVTMRDLGKQPAKAAVGDTFQQGAAFTTGADGTVSIKFEDGQVAIISPNSQFVATTYVFNKAKVADSNILLSLTRGGLRFVSGMIATTNREKFAVRTNTATIGVRGSDGAIALAGDGSIVASTANGAVTLTVGGVTVVIPAGATSFSVAGGTPSGPVSTATVQIPPALAAVAAIIRAIAAANPPNNQPSNPAAVGAAVKAAVALAANPNNVALQQAAAAANQNAVTQNQALIQQAVQGGGLAPAPSGTPTPGTPAAPPLTQQETQILQPLVTPVVPSPS